MEDWHRLFQNHHDADYLVALVAGKLHKTGTPASRCLFLNRATGTVEDSSKRFMARLAPLARAVAYLPPELWDPVVEREVGRWMEAVKVADGAFGDRSLLRVRLTQHRTGPQPVVDPMPPGQQLPVWEIVTDHDIAISSSGNQRTDAQLWPVALRNSVEQALSTIGIMRGGSTAASGQAMVVTSGPYVSSLLLARNRLAEVCRHPDPRFWRAWVVSNSLMLLVESAGESAADGLETRVVESLSRFAQATPRLFQPFSLSLDDLPSSPLTGH